MTILGNSLSIRQIPLAFLYLYFPFNCCWPVLWNNYVHLFAALLTWILGKKWDSLSVLYNGDAYVKSSTLKFEKQGSESCSIKNIDTDFLIFYSVSQEWDMFYENLLTALLTVFALPAN